jgi:signal transduction histidine kinase
VKPFKSIRWRLQIWYGLMLLFVLSGFGITAFELERNRQVRNLDDQLSRRLGAVVATVGRSGPRARPGMPPRNFRPGGLPPEQPPGEPISDGPEDWLPDTGEAQEFRPGFPGPGRGAPGPPRNEFNRMPPIGEFELPRQEAVLFDDSDANGFYYILWRRDGQELRRSTNAPAALAMPVRGNSPDQAGAHMRGTFREMYYFTPPGEVVVVGRSMLKDLADLRRTAWTLAAVGGGVLLVGLAGGWWLAGGAIKPIREISDTAAKISSGDLSQRINATDAQNELGELATVLNSTFARLEAAFAQQRQFTSDAAHELRTPVSVMLTQTQSTLNRPRTAEEYCDTLQACQRAAQRMRRLIESLLELARLDAGQESLKRLPFDLGRTAQECVDSIRPLADERGVGIECKVPALECSGDPERISQVITNLLSNAVHYNRDSGSIRISGEAQNGTVSLSVADTGDGIPADELPNLFKRFHRADKSRANGRSGLGLAISKAIVEAHGGEIVVRSTQGEGTTFTVRLPARAMPPHGQEIPERS